ncbi:MAG TPA: MFS transporter, partial [Candidatus Avipropionibacterium avicola]|nr:MFS transporter [Candidatus Avipropionibacterium avicola]
MTETSSPVAEAAVTDDRSLRILTVGLCIGITAVAFETLAVSTAMPRAAQDLGALGWYAWAFSIFQATMLFATVASGRMCDRIGPVRPMVAGMVVFGIGLAVAGSAPTMSVLILGRAIQGLGSGTMSVAIYVVIARYFPVDRRPRVLSWLSTAWVVPGFVGPLISGWITEHFSWHWVFGSVIPVVLIAALLLVPILVRAERNETDRSRWDRDPAAKEAPVWAAATAALAVPILQFALQSPRWWTVPLLVVALGLLALGLPRLMPAGIWTLRPGLGP